MLSARVVWRGVTWRALLSAQALAFALALLQWRDYDAELRAAVPTTWIFVHFTIWALSALFIVPATLRADEAVKRGSRPLYAYSLGMVIAVLTALLITAAAACVALGYGRAWSHPQPLPSGALSALYVRSLMDMCFTGGLALLCRINQHLARQMLIYIQDIEERRTMLEGRLTDSRIALAESQMESAELLDALAEIRCDLEHPTLGADGKLDELILKLRRAMTRTVVAEEPGWGIP
jgi:hypothetical protein